MCGIDFIEGSNNCLITYSDYGIIVYDYIKGSIIHSINGKGFFCFIVEDGSKAIIGYEHNLMCYDT